MAATGAVAGAVATTLAREKSHTRTTTRIDGTSGSDTNTNDGHFQKAEQSEAVHNRFLADREAELRKKNKKKRGIVEIIARLLGWHPKKLDHTGGDDAIRKLIEDRERRNRGIIDPRTNKLMGHWDLVVVTMLMFTTYVTPYEVVFLTPSRNINLLFVLNRIIDTGFMVDMVIQFNLAFQEPPSKGGQLGSGWIKDRRRIRANYLSFWFWIDLVSVLPIWITNWIFEDPSATAASAAASAVANASAALADGEAGGKSAAEMLQVLRMVRLLRLIKITRILKASRIFKRFETNMEITYAALGMMKLALFLFSWSHLQSCWWGLVPQLFGESVEAGTCASPPCSWIEALQGDGPELLPWDLYVAGLYFSVMTVTSIGYGEMLPVTTTERVICSIMMLTSSIVWCYVMGQACSIAATMDPAAIDFKANMDALNTFMRDRGLPKSLKVELRNYFHNSRRLQRVAAENHVVSLMSPLMQSTVALQVNQIWLNHIWFLRAEWYKGESMLVHSSFIAVIAQKLSSSSYVAQERVAGGLLCIVQRGLAIKRWRFMSAGKVWGEDIILDDVRLIDYSEAVAMTYLEIYTLDRPTLEDASKQFPECAKRIEKASRRMLIQRLIIRAFRIAAGLPPPKSFISQTGPRTHAQPTISLTQKVDLLIDANPDAIQKLNHLTAAAKDQPSDTLGALAGGGSVVYHPDGSPAGARPPSLSAGILAEPDSAVVVAADGASSRGASPLIPGDGTAAASGGSPPSPIISPHSAEDGGADVAAAGAAGGGSAAAAVPAAPPTTMDGAAAAASFDRLVAMHRDVAEMQARMGEEMQKLSASLAKAKQGGAATLPKSMAAAANEPAPRANPAPTGPRSFLPQWGQPDAGQQQRKPDVTA